MSQWKPDSCRCPGSTKRRENVAPAHVMATSQVDTAAAHDVKFIREKVRKSNPKATILEAFCRVNVTVPESIKGRRVRVVQDGPLTYQILTAFTARRKPLPSKVTKK